MLQFANGRNAVLATFVFAVFWHVNIKLACSQSPARILVVVPDASDARCVERIGRGLVHVEVLLSPDGEIRVNDYDVTNQRVRSLLDSQLIFFRNGAVCRRERFWRDRMAAANPRTKLHRMTMSRAGAATDCERKIQQATDVHAALTTVLTDHRPTLDENLRLELFRLQSNSSRYRQLASLR